MNSTPGSAEFAAAGWFKSSYSAANNECVEIAHAQLQVGIRDSKEPVRGVVNMSTDAFTIFVNGVKAGPGALIRWSFTPGRRQS